MSTMPSPSQITAKELNHLYHHKQLSYDLIARELGCSRAYVGKLAKKLNITPRSQSTARTLAIKHGRVPGHHLKGTPEYDAKRRQYNQRGAADRQRRYRKRHPQRIRARWTLQKAIQRGKVVRPSWCEICQISCKPLAHHVDYDRPLDVIWLCHEHHMKAREEKAA